MAFNKKNKKMVICILKKNSNLIQHIETKNRKKNLFLEIEMALNAKFQQIFHPIEKSNF